MPFHSRERVKHFIKHGTDFQATDDIHYETMADRFMMGPLSQNVSECKRRNGDILRYDPATEEFGILAASGLVRTYYKSVPCWALLFGSMADCHPYRDNATYFNAECVR